MKRIIATIIIFSFLALYLAPLQNVQAARKVVDESTIKGTYYSLFNEKSVKLKGNKLTIKSELLSGTKTLKMRSRTFKVPAKIKFYYAESEWYDGGKITRKKFYNLVKKAVKNHFPAIHLWVKDNTIVSCGESA